MPALMMPVVRKVVRAGMGRRSRRRWSYIVIILLMFVIGTLYLNHNSVPDVHPDPPNSADVFIDPVFRARDLFQHIDSRTQQRPQKVLESMSKLHKLAKAQKKIFQNIERPPDSKFNFNVTLSDTISLDRDIDDTRPEPCKARHYDVNSLPRTSVVIPFYNEAFSMLLRTIHSILNRTPEKLLEEIILVDDNSTYEYLHQPLDRYIRLLPKVKVLRNTNREGLIRSRLRGCQISVSPIVVFLDAHTEVNVGWLEPMLVELQRHPNTIVQPFIDGIDTVTMMYSRPNNDAIYKGGFSWDLR